jgi:5'-nucleotidase
MPSARPLVLLSNDDGYQSRGLLAMREALLGTCDVVVVAPEHEQSASSHALSLREPLRLRTVSEGVHALSGTPADCVYVGLHAGPRVLSRRPDLVVSGINLGLNLGQDVFYSGTVAAAREAALRGIPALATSMHVSLDVARVATASASVARALLADHTEMPRRALLSANFPKGWTGAIRATKLGERIYEEKVDFRADPYGRDYLWLGGPGVRHSESTGTDTEAYDERVASVTPLLLDLTSQADIPGVSRILAASGIRDDGANDQGDPR